MQNHFCKYWFSKILNKNGLCFMIFLQTFTEIYFRLSSYLMKLSHEKINCAYFCTGNIFGKSKPQQLLVLVLHIKNQYAKLRGSECNLDDFLLTWITESNRGDQFFCWTVFGLNKVFWEIKHNESFIQLLWLKNRNQSTN